MKPYEKTRLIKWAKRYIGEDADKIDINALVDSSLSYYEARNELKQKIDELYPVPIETRIERKEITRKDIKSQEEMIEVLNQRELEKEEKKAELEFMKSLEKIEKENSKVIEEIYYVPKNYAKMVALGYSNGMIFLGEAGVGKSFTYISAFKEAGKKFVYATGFTTSLQLYHFLYEHRKEHILFDDDRILDNQTNLDMLKSALYSPKGVRIVEYNTTSPRLKVPNKFIFEGTISIILNKLKKKNEDLRAVADRVLFYEFKLSYKEKMKILFELAKKDYKDLSLKERLMIVNWIKDNTDECVENLNLRLLFKIYEIYRYDRQNWKKLAGKLIIKNKELNRLKEILDKHKADRYPVKEAEKEFIELGLGSRATFYRLKSKLESELP